VPPAWSGSADTPQNENTFYSGDVHIGDTTGEAAFRAEVRAFLDAHATPKGAPDDISAGMFGPYDEDTYTERAIAWQRIKYDHGWAAPGWPKAVGGRGLRPIESAIFNQEQAAYGVNSGPFMISIGMAGPTILQHGTDEQRARFLPPMLRGDELWCQLFSEPEAGSDLASLRTVAVRDGDEFVVNGQKVWTSSTRRAQWGMLLARTKPDAPKREGITYFLVDMRTSGIEPRPLRQMTGDAHFAEVFLTDVRVPAANVLGEVDGGWKVARTTLTNERSSIAGGSTGIDAPGLARLANGRSGEPIVRQVLAQAHIRQELLRFFRYRTLTALSQGRPPGTESSLMKLAYGQHLKALTDAALTVLGMGGLLHETGDVVQDAWLMRFLHSPSLRIAGGSDEVQRNIIGEQVLGLPREPTLPAPFQQREQVLGLPREPTLPAPFQQREQVLGLPREPQSS
jgi:acyl-CoA dehydrogenase